MANPQLENGYTRISNELLDAIGKANFSATELEIVLCVVRFTYGFGRTSHKLSASFIAEWTKRNKRGIKECLKKLTNNNVIVVINSQVGKTSEIGLNKNYEEWQGVSGVAEYTSVAEYTTPVYDNTPVVVYHSTPKKENIKEKSKENIYSEFFETLWKLYPRKRGKSSVTSKAKKELYATGYEKVVSAIEAYKKEIAGREERYILQGSTFFNGRWKEFVTEIPYNDMEGKSIETVFDRFNGLEEVVFKQYRELGIIDDEGNIDLFLANDEQKSMLQKVGAL